MPGQAPVHTDERELLLGYIDQQRDGVRYAAFGLTDDQARLTPSASTLSVGALVRHVAFTERGWIDLVADRAAPPSASDYEQAFTFGPGDTLAGALMELDAVAAETASVVHAIDDLDCPVPVPKGVPWYPADLDNWTVRWVLLHLVEEIARHAGHADIIRESIDGATMYSLMAAAEGWPATPWLQPWSPPDA